MPCRRCSGQPPVPYERTGFPTIRAWGPFKDHAPVPYEPVPDEAPVTE